MGDLQTADIINFFQAINKETKYCLNKSEAEMRKPMRRTEQRLSWDGEAERYCHFHVATSTELATFLHLNWEKRKRERKKDTA